VNSTKPQLECPICKEDYLDGVPTLLESMDGSRCECQRCGTFDLARALHVENNPDFDRVRHLVSAWVRQQTRLGVFPVVVGKGMDFSSNDWPLRFEHMGFPSTVNEKLDALLLVYADRSSHDLQAALNQYEPQLISEVAARDGTEVRALTKFLAEFEYVAPTSPTGLGLGITGKGWLRVDELRQRRSSGDSAFMAMWFDTCTEDYRKAAIAAADYCGYRAVIVDQEEFNGFIMDRVVALIRESRFVIADYTCRPEIDGAGSDKVQRGVRGGVYWEAGMAYGLNKPVIHTCKKSEEAKRRMHFDVDQYTTIFWQDDQLGTEIRDMSGSIQNPNFAERLAAHILGTVGRGSHVPS
jgi:hypothetical protein